MKTHVWLLFLAVTSLLLAGCNETNDPMAIGVKSVSLDKTSKTLLVGGTEQLVATVLPEDAVNKTVVWSSDAEDVASVDASTGLVTALEAGTAKITATTEDGGYTASCAVTVTTDMEAYLKALLLEDFGQMGLSADFFSDNHWTLDNALENWNGIRVSGGPDDYGLSIDLEGQILGGALCDELFRLPGLTELVLSGCKLSGPIPESIGEATRLASLNLGNNDFTGQLPSSLGKLANLLQLDVSGNKLTGAVPEEMKGLDNYPKFRFNPQQEGYEISETGTGDTDKAALLSIVEAWGDDAPQIIQDSWTAENAVTIFYGVEVNGLGQVVALNLRSLKIYALPDMSALTQLKRLDMYDNELWYFPAWIGNLTNLQYLDLGYTVLLGQFPTAICNLPNLKHLYLAKNLLSGEIPAEIGNMSNLEALDLSSNGFTGQIPATISNMSNLKVLDLGSNLLSGQIPAEFGNLTNLQGLYLSYNRAE